VTFWDSSAIVPLLVEEPASKALAARFASDSTMLVWWATEVECVSALCRLERDGALPAKGLQTALARLDRLASRWYEVLPGAGVRETARRLLRVHPLRAADSLQLAAAIEAAEGRPARSVFLTFDQRLQDAALREGFDVG
jgi:predicted nucleic acid-binding protein